MDKMTGEDWLDKQIKLSRTGGDFQDISEAFCIAHYLFREEGKPFSPAHASTGEMIYKQKKRPN